MNDPVAWAKSVAELVKGYVARHLAPIESRLHALESRPAPQLGEKGEPGRDGVDGKSVTLEEVRNHLDAEIAMWALAFERRAQDLLQRAIDRMPTPKDGAPGEPGRDGFSLDDVQIEQCDERSVVLRFARGDLVREHTLRLNHPIYRDVYQHGRRYECDDVVTFGGSAWIATRDTDSKPGTDDSWKLMVKKGRDGKDWRPPE